MSSVEQSMPLARRNVRYNDGGILALINSEYAVDIFVSNHVPNEISLKNKSFRFKYFFSFIPATYMQALVAFISKVDKLLLTFQSIRWTKAISARSYGIVSKYDGPGRTVIVSGRNCRDRFACFYTYCTYLYIIVFKFYRQNIH